jgi:CheY-like chemotaxis protein
VATNKILVIDDTAVVRAKVREMLPPGTFEVIEAKDGLEGYKLIQTEKVTVIMLDFILPRMSGWQVFQNIQAQPELKRIPLVIMSGNKGEVTEKIIEPFEYFEFLGKPFDQKQLISAIKSAINKAKNQPPEPAPAPTPIAVQKTSVVTSATSTSDSSAEIKLLNDKIIKMQAEIDNLKKQITQIVTFIKQKIK